MHIVHVYECVYVHIYIYIFIYIYILYLNTYIYISVHTHVMYVCTSQPYLNLFLPWHRCQAIHSCSRSHINTTIKISNAPATNKRKSLLLLLVQYTASTTTISLTSQATQQNKYYRRCVSEFETWQWRQTFLLSTTFIPALQLNQTSYSIDTMDSTPQVKWQGHEANHSPLSSAQVNN